MDPRSAESGSYQQIPQVLFRLVQKEKIDHVQFFILAYLHFQMDYQHSGVVVLSYDILEERLAVKRRTLISKMKELVKAGIIGKRKFMKNLIRRSPRAGIALKLVTS